MKPCIQQKDGILIIGQGETIESCFVSTASSMFSMMADIHDIHTLQIVTFEFEESKPEKALIIWLNLLLTKSREHQLIFGDFRLKRTGDKWEATISGEPWRDAMQREVEIKCAVETTGSINKVDHAWQSRCLVKI